MARVILGRGVRHPQPQGVEDPFRKTAATPRNSTNLDGSVHPLVPPTLARSNRRRRTTSDVHPVEILTQSAVRASLPSGARGSSFRTDTAHSDIASKPATPQAIRAPALQVTSVDDPFCMDISMGDNASPPATSSVARATKPASARGSSLFGELPQGDNSSPPPTPRTVRATKPASARGSSLFGELPQGDNSSPPPTPRTVGRQSRQVLGEVPYLENFPKGTTPRRQQPREP